MNGSHLALGATALLALASSIARRGSRDRYVARGDIPMNIPYEFEFDSDYAIDDHWELVSDARHSLRGADYEDFWKDKLEEAWRWGTWSESDWDNRMEVKEAAPPSIRDRKLGRGRHRPKFLGGE